MSCSVYHICLEINKVSSFSTSTSMSLRIKLPAKAAELESNPQSSTAEPSSRRRKVTKRRLAVVSDEEDDDHDQRQSTAALSSPPGTSSLRGRSHTVEGDSDFERERATHIAPEHHLPESSLSTFRLKKHKARDGPPPPKKKRIHVDVNSDEDYRMGAASGDDDEDFVNEVKRQSKLTAKVKAKGGKAKASKDGDALTKEERKALHGRLQPNSTEVSQAAGTKRSRASSKAEDAAIDVVGDMNTRPDTRSPSQPREPSSPPPKKRKFPTIKKNKPPGTAFGSTSSAKAPSAAASAKLAVPIPEAAKPPAYGARKTPATLGNADFDLRNANVYNELFKPAGGSTPRSGLSRREKDEERRKELNKMRDEARAKRLAEMATSFDLQAQSDKIGRFEERLRVEQSSALYPNFLAAKWRELWERERRKAKEQGWADGRNWGETGEREEGEMNDQPNGR
ncbi:hypothetical protein D9615_003954 [Tricholomella constricta]|uniref:Uncharacterized protein n=1 Tax=Tricholomella constricta TaxID=117010 RepID=A0A8H5HCY7_9AGAR|nr:hypothetical protein D9615_003954 [Tricholomella constricta]